MPKTITLMIYRSGDNIDCRDWETVRNDPEYQGITEEQAKSVMGDALEFLKINLKPRSYEIDKQIERYCIVPDDKSPENGGGYRFDGTLVAEARFAAVVESWSRTDPISESTFCALDSAITRVLIDLLFKYTDPPKQDFLPALKELQGDSKTDNSGPTNTSQNV